jgi:hypothetical protein
MELISPLLRMDYREFCVPRFAISQIDKIFMMAGVKKGKLSPDKMINGQRRALIEEYYALNYSIGIINLHQ